MQERQLHRSHRALKSALEPIVWADEEGRHEEDQVGKDRILLVSRSYRELRGSITIVYGLFPDQVPLPNSELCILQAIISRTTWGQQPSPRRCCNQGFLGPSGLEGSNRGHCAPGSAAELPCLPPCSGVPGTPVTC